MNSSSLSFPIFPSCFLTILPSLNTPKTGRPLSPNSSTVSSNISVSTLMNFTSLSGYSSAIWAKVLAAILQGPPISLEGVQKRRGKRIAKGWIERKQVSLNEQAGSHKGVLGGIHRDQEETRRAATYTSRRKSPRWPTWMSLVALRSHYQSRCTQSHCLAQCCVFLN